ncbi:hypothetical protein [Caballeronia sp. SBC2]|uniref:hypothetical protein n=1 Tax=Caballeronia sp. SBC2 TaxID=2705547 RepID=UPI0013E1E90A|nr:hypothetical protein [Caballeronia sp. SBC2]QIE22966.1 hypothetical protein SBC2_09790 [Caballeronia sp. SBC2]
MTDTFFIDPAKLEPRANTLYLEVSHDVSSWERHPVMMALPAESLVILEHMHRETLEPVGPYGVGGRWSEHYFDGQLLLALPFGGVRDISTGEHYPSVVSSEERRLWAKSWKRVHGTPWGHYETRPLLPLSQVRATCAKEMYVERDGLVTLRWASNALGDYRFIKPALFRIGDWPAIAHKQLATPPIVHRTRHSSLLPWTALLRAGLLQLREGWVGVAVSHTLPEWVNSPIVAAIPEESLESLAAKDVNELPEATLLTIGNGLNGEVNWGNYGLLPLARFEDPFFPLQQKVMRWNDGSVTLEWENCHDLEPGPCIVTEALYAKV